MSSRGVKNPAISRFRVDIPQDLQKLCHSVNCLVTSLSFVHLSICIVDTMSKPIHVYVSSRYEQDGVNWIAFLARYKLHGILCDDMGLGKTLQTLCVVAGDHYQRQLKYEVCLLLINVITILEFQTCYLACSLLKTLVLPCLQ